MYQNAWLKSQLCFQPAFLQTFILGQADDGQRIWVPTTPDTYTEFLVLGFNMASLGYCRHLASGPVDRRISLFLSLCLSDMLCYFVIETLFKTLLTNKLFYVVFLCVLQTKPTPWTHQENSNQQNPLPTHNPWEQRTRKSTSVCYAISISKQFLAR